MLRIIIVWFTTTLCFTAISQEALKDLEWGKETPRNYEYDTRVIGISNNKILSIDEESNVKITVDEVDLTSLEIIKSSSIKLKFDKRFHEYYSSFILENQLFVISSFKNLSDDRIYYYYHLYHENGTLSDPILIGSTSLKHRKGLFSYSNEKYQYRYILKIGISSDKKTIAFVIPEDLSPNKEDQNIWHFVLMDKNFDLSKSLDFSLDKNTKYIKSIEVNNDGVVYCEILDNVIPTNMETALYYDTDKSLGKFNLVGEEYFLGVVDTKRNTIYENRIPLPFKKTKSIKMNMLGDHLFFYGINYPNDVPPLNTFLIQYDYSGNLISHSNHDIHWDSLKLEKGTSQLSLERNQQVMDRFGLGDLFEADNGDIIYILEDFYLNDQTSTSTNTGMTTGGASNHYDNIYIFSYDNTGEYKWAGAYQKSQISRYEIGGYCSSYKLINTSTGVYLLFINDERVVNKEDSWDKLITHKKSGVYGKNVGLAYLKLDSEGNLTDGMTFLGPDLGKHSISIRNSLILGDTIYFPAIKCIPFEYFSTKMKYGKAKIH